MKKLALRKWQKIFFEIIFFTFEKTEVSNYELVTTNY